ncbi:MAG TPA: protein kinase [Pirellulaceae bacterium]|nr:protein kinase [Pirellulaceae bacterium]HMO94383.1 protein kinase [Pirellulaceae bacterium]HMP78745.1 protein kinase [Pirellulaceae bacterium]
MRDLEIFSQAIEIDEPQKRRNFVRAACAGDASLRDRVEILLRSYEQSGSILDQPLINSEVADHLVEIAPDDKQNVGGENRSASEGSSNSLLRGTERNIGPYRLLEKIGEGGFGDVFVAEQIEPVERKVAIKIIKPGMDSREVVARFAAERQALAMMDHPNIARVFDAGTTPRGLPYFVMELVRGMNIVKYCDTAKLPIEKRLSLFVDTCKAIQHAHQKGIIHRDIKPSNVLVTLHDGEPVVKVIDFGVAKALNQRLTHMTVYTRFSFMIGTPIYMSPEQAELSGLDIDTRSDIYSLGVLLYELVTGSPPFMPERFAKATIDEMRRIIRDEEPPRPSTRISSLGESSSSVAQLRSVQPERLRTILRRDLDWIAMKALAKDRSQRYETANGLAADVKRFLEGDAVTARPPSWSYLASRFVRRNRGLVISAALIFAALFLGSVISISLAIWALREQRVAYEQEQRAINKTNEAIVQQERAERAESEAIGNLLESRLAFTDLNLKSRRPGQQVASLDAIRESIELARQTNTLDQYTLRLRSQTISALAQVDLKHIRSCDAPPEAAKFFSFTADFSQIAYRVRENDQNFVTIRSVESPDQELYRVPFPFNTQAAFHDEVVPKLSRDGRYLAMGNGQMGLTLWDLSQNSQVRELKAFNPIGGFQFSHDSTKFVVVEYHGPGNPAGRASICRLPSGEIERSIELPKLLQVSFSPDGSRIALGGPSNLLICDVATGKKLASIEKWFDGWGPSLAWSASGEYLATSVDKQIEIWSVQALIKSAASKASTTTVAPVSVLSGHEGKVDSLIFHPIHEFLLISSGWDSATRIWNIFSGVEQLMVPEPHPSLSADGSRLSTSTTSGFVLYNILGGDACRWIWRGNVAQVVIGPQGNWLSMGTAQGTRFWSLPGLTPLGALGLEDSFGLAWDQATDGLLLGNELGLFEFPVSLSQGVLSLGASRQLLTTSLSNFCQLNSSINGRWISANELEDWEAILLDRSTGNAHRIHRDVRTLCHAISGDSRWLAQFGGGRVFVRDLNTGRDIARLPLSGTNCGVCFSPDSRYLILSTDHETQFVNTTNWAVEHRFRPAIRIFAAGFSSNQDICAIPSGPGELSLVSTSDYQALAQLNYPDPPRLFGFATFSPDDQYILVSHETSAAVWNLGLVRKQLLDFGLDWHSTAAPLAAVPVPINRLTVEPGDYDTLHTFFERVDATPRQEVAAIADELITSGLALPDLFHFRGWSYEALGDYDSACRDLEKAVELAPYAESWRRASANCFLQARRYREAWEVYWSMADATHSNSAVAAFNALCYICAARPDAASNLHEFEKLLEKWLAALSGQDTSTSFGVKVAGLSDAGRQSLWENVGMALHGLNQPERALAILQEYARPDHGGCNSVLAVIHAESGNREAAETYLTKAVDFHRMSPGAFHYKLNLHHYEPLHERARAELTAEREQSTEVDSEFAKHGAIDSVDLAKAASVKFGRLILAPVNDKPEIQQALGGNLVWWELFRPNHEVCFDIPVPGPGSYRLSVTLVGSHYCGKFQVIRDDGETGPEIDLYRIRQSPNDPLLTCIEDFALGEFQAVHEHLAMRDGDAEDPLAAAQAAAQQPVAKWTIPLVLRSIGKHEKATQYSLLIDEIRWERVEQ